MTSGAFTADPNALDAASKAFSAQTEPINTAATKAEQLHASGGQAGRDYASQGNAYHAAFLTMIQTLFTPMATKTVWVADTLSASAASYRADDQQNAQRLNAAPANAPKAV